MRPSKAYDDQKRHADARGIDWQFTYEEWLEMWLLSNKWEQRGRKPDEYCMSRYGDEGPYSIRNCCIKTNKENQRERWEGREKITNPLAREIVEAYLTTKVTQEQVAKMFGVDQSYVSRIVSTKRKKGAQ